jgi:hypothetical protein
MAGARSSPGFVGAEISFGWEVATPNPTIVIPPDSQSNQRSITYETQPPLGSSTTRAGARVRISTVHPSFARAVAAAPAGQEDQQKSQVFVGKVIKARDGRYALLTDEQAGKGVYLDDQEKAKQFEGKNVKVTGVLEVARNLVHVTDIEPAA